MERWKEKQRKEWKLPCYVRYICICHMINVNSRGPVTLKSAAVVKFWSLHKWSKVGENTKNEHTGGFMGADLAYVCVTLQLLHALHNVQADVCYGRLSGLVTKNCGTSVDFLDQYLLLPVHDHSRTGSRKSEKNKWTNYSHVFRYMSTSEITLKSCTQNFKHSYVCVNLKAPTSDICEYIHEYDFRLLFSVIPKSRCFSKLTIKTCQCY